MRARLAAVVAVALLLSGSATAYGAWRPGAAVGAGDGVTSGSIGVTTAWSPALNLAAMFPGETRPEC